MEKNKVIEHLQQLKCDYTNYWEETHDEMTDALDNAIADEKKIDQVIRDYEKLCDFMSEQGLDGVACTKKVDEFCIDTMRGLLGEHYAERIGYGTDEKTSA